MIIRIFLGLLTSVFTIGTFLPVVKSDYWTFRILEYPRLQKFIIGLFIVAACFFTREDTGNLFWWMLPLLIVSLTYLVIKIFPYTPLAPKEMKRVKAGDPANEIRIFTANVLQTNHAFDKMLKQVKRQDPDVIFLVETDKNWEKALSELEKEYQHTLKKPLNNTYGLLFYSRLPMHDAEVKFLAEDDIPSIQATVKLKNGVEVRVHGLHPKPPVPDESLTSTAKDKELMKVALSLEHFDDPCIVMGDLNDVAWSYVTKLFRKVSGLLDPRRGRGFYSTFSANRWWMRFPLDYIFCSSHFGLVEMKKMPHNGSDHFAMFIHLQYKPVLEEVQDKPEADSEEKEAAVEKANTPT
jgi:endonuclease/exonuclease/phosphatase (EEP) superfamily protein YafD